ncbi:MAG: DUF5615 family PIN-like protein [Candidatus Scalindua sp.]|nr:DUF5615 family PIN-like protein [Candidatus Scalindua sp.]
MNIFVDENIPLITVQTLQKLGHKVLDIRGTSKEGMGDDVLWQKTQNEKRLIITTDKGFSQNRNMHNYGILIVRQKHQSQSRIHIGVMHAVQQFSEKEWIDLLVVVQDSVQSVWRATQS